MVNCSYYSISCTSQNVCILVQFGKTIINKSTNWLKGQREEKYEWCVHAWAPSKKMHQMAGKNMFLPSVKNMKKLLINWQIKTYVGLDASAWCTLGQCFLWMEKLCCYLHFSINFFRSRNQTKYKEWMNESASAWHQSGVCIFVSKFVWLIFTLKKDLWLNQKLLISKYYYYYYYFTSYPVKEKFCTNLVTNLSFKQHSIFFTFIKIFLKRFYFTFHLVIDISKSWTKRGKSNTRTHTAHTHPHKLSSLWHLFHKFQFDLVLINQ